MWDLIKQGVVRRKFSVRGKWNSVKGTNIQHNNTAQQQHRNSTTAIAAATQFSSITSTTATVRVECIFDICAL